MMNEAPMSFAPAVAHKPIGPCAKTATVSPMRMFADSAPLAAKLLQNATLKVYKDLPHGMPATHPDIVNAELLAFIKG